MTWQVNFTITDGSQTSSRLTMHFNDSLTVAQVTDAAQQAATLVDALIDGAITNIGAVLQIALPGGLDAVAPNSAVERGARFIFNSAGIPKATFRIPTFLDAKVTPNSDVVNTADADVLALTNALTAGIAVVGAGTATLQNYLGDDVTSLASAAKAHQRQRK